MYNNLYNNIVHCFSLIIITIVILSLYYIIFNKIGVLYAERSFQQLFIIFKYNIMIVLMYICKKGSILNITHHIIILLFSPGITKADFSM